MAPCRSQHLAPRRPPGTPTGWPSDTSELHQTFQTLRRKSGKCWLTSNFLSAAAKRRSTCCAPVRSVRLPGLGMLTPSLDMQGNLSVALYSRPRGHAPVEQRRQGFLGRVDPSREPPQAPRRPRRPVGCRTPRRSGRGLRHMHRRQLPNRENAQVSQRQIDRLPLVLRASRWPDESEILRCVWLFCG